MSLVLDITLKGICRTLFTVSLYQVARNQEAGIIGGKILKDLATGATWSGKRVKPIRLDRIYHKRRQVVHPMLHI